MCLNATFSNFHIFIFGEFIKFRNVFIRCYDHVDKIIFMFFDVFSTISGRLTWIVSVLCMRKPRAMSRHHIQNNFYYYLYISMFTLGVSCLWFGIKWQSPQMHRTLLSIPAIISRPLYTAEEMELTKSGSWELFSN